VCNQTLAPRPIYGVQRKCEAMAGGKTFTTSNVVCLTQSQYLVAFRYVPEPAEVVDSWRFNVHSPLAPDVTITARLAPGNASILDYFFIPSAKGRRYSGASVLPSDVQQFDDLTYLQDVAKWGRGRRRVPNK
jgi:hypothetical protein